MCLTVYADKGTGTRTRGAERPEVLVTIKICEPETGRSVEEGPRGVNAVTVAPTPPVAGSGSTEVVVGIFIKDPYS